MSRVITRYRCPTCGATKEIRDEHGASAPPVDVPCGWRGCVDRAVRETNERVSRSEDTQR